MLSAGLFDKNPRSVPSCGPHQAIRKADLSAKTLSTLMWWSTLFLAAFGSAGCSARGAGSADLQSLTPARAAAIDESARTFMHTVAHDVTQEGPLAWLKFFNTGPEFFMAVNGQLAFPNAAAARALAAHNVRVSLSTAASRIFRNIGRITSGLPTTRESEPISLAVNRR